MPTKTIKISEDNYRWLSMFAGELQQQWGNPVSIDEALGTIRKGKSILALAGSWDMTDSEAKNMNLELKKTWKRWQIESV